MPFIAASLQLKTHPYDISSDIPQVFRLLHQNTDRYDPLTLVLMKHVYPLASGVSFSQRIPQSYLTMNHVWD